MTKEIRSPKIRRTRRRVSLQVQNRLFADFGRRLLHRFSRVKLFRLTFAAQTHSAVAQGRLAAKSQIKAGLISLPAIGGMKNRGNAPSGTCKSITEPCFALMRARLRRAPARQAREPGRLMGSMTNGEYKCH